MRCAPPSGTGQPNSWPSIASSQPYTPLPASSVDRSVCNAQPAISSWAPSPRNISRPSLRLGRISRRASRSAPAGRSRASSAAPPRTGGNGVKSASSIGAETVRHCAYADSQRSPSPAANSSTEAAVVSGRRLSVAARPSGSRWVSTSGACRQVTPWSVRRRSRITGDAYPSG